MDLDPDLVKRVVAEALAEDLGPGDVTSESIIPEEARAAGEIVSRQGGVVCGIPIAREVFLSLDGSAEVEEPLRDGDRTRPGDVILRVRGPARALLAGERTALNFLQRLSGISTLTRAFVDAVQGSGAKILDTRKTTPLMRALEKYAVRMGGGENHRMGLHDQAMIKNNHHAFLEAGDEALRRAVRAARKRGVIVTIEAADREEALRAARAGADIVLLDNFPVDALPATISALRSPGGPAPLIEVSGGVTLDNVRILAGLGPDRISVGALTHSAPALDISLGLHPFV